jgi:glycosyltransferase involved in cell wall biosynthesis
MRIAYDGRVLALEKTGDRVYLVNLLREMADLMRPEDLWVYTDARRANQALDLPVTRRSVPMGRLGKTLLWAKYLRAESIDLCHVQYFGPLNAPCPVVTSIHDVSFAAHPEFFAPKARIIFRLFMRVTIRRAGAIIVPSESTKREMERLYRESRGKVEVVPLAGSDALEPVPRGEAAERLRHEFGIDFPFVLLLGQVHPRKNVARVVEAFAGIAGEFGDLRLISVGPDTWQAEQVWRLAESKGLGDRIVRPGVVGDRDVACFLSAASLFCYMSLYEGFGLPVLEAMKCGAPVLASNTTSIPEVAGNAALLVDPLSTDEIREGMRRILADEAYREQLRELGRQRCQEFTWNETARRTLGIYRRMT